MRAYFAGQPSTLTPAYSEKIFNSIDAVFKRVSRREKTLCNDFFLGVVMYNSLFRSGQSEYGYMADLN
jgi:hypothetical protein